ncbi:hypothetical protein V8G54_001396 [Vigna mungo]|uniref:Pentatricopeptide repeat-containing protein n=1 Tax=Vigna mungo TaxID=3915 RepID=A0AAQ3P972_VIGMU
MKCLREAQTVDDSLLLYKELDSSSKSSGICNELLKELFKLGCIDDALHMMDEMLEQDSNFPPDDFTGEVVFGVLGKQERHGRSFADNEIVGLVTKLCEHGVFPDAFKLTQMITKMCWHRKNGVAWELLHVVMRWGGAVAVKAASYNALLTGLRRERDTQRMNNWVVFTCCLFLLGLEHSLDNTILKIILRLNEDVRVIRASSW